MSTKIEMKKVLASTFTMFLKTQFYHWNVEGENFEQLHAGLLQKQYDELYEANDVIAEHIRTMGTYAPGSYERFEQLSVIKSTNSIPKEKKMLMNLKKDHEAIIEQLNKTVSFAKKENDEATVNLLADRLSAHKKHLWMINSSLKK
jgi:starvation-inducible DNA-binding protein